MLPDELLNDPDFKIQALTRLKQQNELGEIELEAARRQNAIARNSGDARGHFTYTGPIMEDGVHTFIGICDNWSSRNPGKDIEILLNSPGGSVTDGLALIDYIYLLRKRGHHIKIVGTGMVASMAGVILQAANERALTSRAYFGMHEVSSYVGGTTTQQEDALKFTKQLQARCVDMLVQRSNMTPAKLKAMWKRKDIWCDAKKALEMGVIDVIEDTEPDGCEAP
jgi:ATP-dependent protease ClpP protease subunit